MQIKGYKEIPGLTDIGLGPKLSAKDKFGNSLSGYQGMFFKIFLKF